MEPLNKELVIDFTEHFSEDIRKKFGDNASVENVVYHMVEKGICTKIKVRNYVLVNDFYKYMSDHEGTVINFCIENEDRYNLTSEGIKSMIYKYVKNIETATHIK